MLLNEHNKLIYVSVVATLSLYVKVAATGIKLNGRTSLHTYNSRHSFGMSWQIGKIGQYRLNINS